MSPRPQVVVWEQFPNAWRYNCSSVQTIVQSINTTVLQPTVKSLREGDAFCLLQIGEKDSLLYLEVKGGDLQAKENHPSNEAQGVSIMWCGSLAAGGIGASHKIDGIMRQEIYVAILKQYRKTSARKLKACLPSKYTSKRVAKWLKDKKAKVLERPSQNSDVNSTETLWEELKNVCNK